MASWFFHSLLYSKHIETHDVPEEMRDLFHLGCFAPDLVAERSLKKQTHFGFGPNKIPIRYQIEKYKKAFSYSNLVGPDELWFHRGYLLHLRTDAIWMKNCIRPFLPKFLLSSARWRDAGTLYYGEMIAIDEYFRSKYLHFDAEAVSLRLLSGARIPTFFPTNLDAGRAQDVIGLLSRTRGNLSNEMITRFIRERSVDRFLEEVCAVSL